MDKSLWSTMRARTYLIWGRQPIRDGPVLRVPRRRVMRLNLIMMAIRSLDHCARRQRQRATVVRDLAILRSH